MDGITVGKAIAEHGISIVTGILLVFIVGLSCYLIKQIMSMFRNELKDLHKDGVNNTTLNNEAIKGVKDVAVIQAQTLDKLDKHDKDNAETWSKMLTGFDRICDFLNGKNPAIAKVKAEMQAEIKELEKKIK